MFIACLFNILEAVLADTFMYMSNFSLWRPLSCAPFICKIHMILFRLTLCPIISSFVTLIPKLLSAKTVLDLHEPSPELWGLKFGGKKEFLIRFVAIAAQLAIKFTDHAITVSEQMKENYIKRGAKASKISVVLNVPNLEFNYELYEEELKAAKKDYFSLVCHGSIIKRYGQDVAVKAINLVKDDIPEIRLNIMGTGEYEANVKQLVSELKLEKYVHFLGFIPFLDMIKTVGSADIGLVPVEKNDYSDLVHTNKMFEFIAMKRERENNHFLHNMPGSDPEQSEVARLQINSQTLAAGL